MINYITLYGLVWLFTNFTPLQKRLDNHFLNKPQPTIGDIIIYEILQCQKCLTFWIFIFIFPLHITLIATMAAQIHTKLIK